jgi:hypothetical protein
MLAGAGVAGASGIGFQVEGRLLFDPDCESDRDVVKHTSGAVSSELCAGMDVWRL